MDVLPRIVIADRSELAANIYRLLLEQLAANVVVRRRFEEARPHFFRREKVALAIVNSNIFGKKFPEIAAHLAGDEPLVRLPKLFLCRDNPAETAWRDELVKLPGARVLVRPFHPDEFTEVVRAMIGRSA